MDENLVGYLLDALDPEERRKVEAYLDANPAARARLDALRQALEPLAADLGDDEPPPRLAARTLANLAGQSCGDLPRSPVPAGRSAGPVIFAVWRRADVLVAACLMLTALGLLGHWLFSLHRPDGAAQLTACQENLRRIYVGLKNYSDLHRNEFPNVARVAHSPRNVAALVVPVLLESGALPEPVSVSCPATGDVKPCPWTLRDLEAMDPDKFRKSLDALATCYAYSLGYKTENEVVGLRFDPAKPMHRLPLMADCPLADPSAGNSPNHAGKGQNVLFMDGHVEFCTVRTVGVRGDDIFLNKAAQVAAGLDWQDSVLGRGTACPAP
jgi:prepilin-type processing-associated H-X9-DG protein